ncbi:hypothetical protein F5148DRAFT_1151931 [Russula earlei]|uniref:Uncharacterized protein n=1 Tax=Russula earlei TaxID=71964 RepID=A0ACC0TYH8_9AGAM|nr:hypothetical protein F5148DRAFT_1151931 [Russula earlei]
MANVPSSQTWAHRRHGSQIITVAMGYADDSWPSRWRHGHAQSRQSSSQPQHGGAGDGKEGGEEGSKKKEASGAMLSFKAMVVVLITTAVTQEETGMGGSIQGPVWKTVERGGGRRMRECA